MAVSIPVPLATYASTSNVTTSGAVSATDDAPEGALVIAAVAGGGASQTLGFSDSAGNSYTALDAVSIPSGVASTGRLFYSFITNPIEAGTTTFTATKGVAGGIAFTVEYVTGADAVGSQVSGVSSVASNPATTDSPVPVEEGGLLYAVGIIGGPPRTMEPDGDLAASTFAQSSGSGNPRSAWTFYQLITADGSVTPAASIDVNNAYAMIALPISGVEESDGGEEPVPAGPVSEPLPVAKYESTGNVTTSGAVTATEDAAEGDLLIASLAAGSNSATLTFSDSEGNVWEAADPVVIPSGVATTGRMFYCWVTKPIEQGSTTFTAGRGSSGGLAFIVERFTGAVSVSSPQVGMSTSPSNPATTDEPVPVVADGCLYAVAFIGGSPRTMTAGTGMTASTFAQSSDGFNPRSAWSFYRMTSANGEYTPTATIDVNNVWAMAAISIGPAYSGEPDPGGLPATLAIIGDSLTERGADHAAPPTREATTRAVMVAAGYDPTKIYWYGRGGKSMHAADSNGKTVADCIAEARSQLGQVDRWVIALGTNDSADTETNFKAEVNAVLDEIYATGDEPDQVFWVNLAALNPNNTNFLAKNGYLKTVIEGRDEYPDRVHLADWYSYIHDPANFDPDDWLPSDVPHMTVQGSAKRDAFIADQVRALPPSVDVARIGGVLRPVEILYDW